MIWIEKFKSMGPCTLDCVEGRRGSTEERVIFADMLNVGMFKRVDKAVSRTGIFHILFALFFLTLMILICPDPILSTSPHSFQTILPIHSVHR